MAGTLDSAAGATVTPSRGVSSSLPCSSLPALLAWCSVGSVPSVIDTFFSAPSWSTASLNVLPGAMAAMRRASSREPFTSLPSTCVMTSPDRCPLWQRDRRLRLVDQCAFDLLHPEAVGDLRRDRLDADADIAARHVAVLLELRHDRLRRIGGDVEADADRTAGRREDRGVDADDIAIDVERRAAGIAAG